ncbi:MAG: sugar ABC transporter permease [Proteobacteria bacterium]|nr:sugar ABC transporter permease [Pseudomonadota bacterium]
MIRKTPWKGYNWLWPVLILIAIIELIPFCVMLVYSVEAINYLDISATGQYIGLDNYREALNDSDFISSIVKLSKVIATALPIEFILGLLVALSIAAHPKLRKYLLPIIIIPMIISPVVVGLIGSLNLNADFGLVGITLKQLGLVEKTILGNYHLALPAIITIDIWQWTPFLILIFTAGLLSLPREPYEAAYVDGASTWQVFHRVTLPLMRPIFLIALLLRFTDLFKIFDKIFIMTEGGPGSATEISNIFAYRINFRFWNLGYGAAIVTLLYIVSFLVCFAFVKIATARD